MRLHDLVDNRQSQPGTAFEIRLERLEDFLNLLRSHSGSGVRKRDLPFVIQGFDRSRQRPAVFHGAYCVLAKIPEDLLELVAIRHRPGLFDGKVPLDRMPVFSAVMRWSMSVSVSSTS